MKPSRPGTTPPSQSRTPQTQHLTHQRLADCLFTRALGEAGLVKAAADDGLEGHGGRMHDGEILIG